MPILLHSPLQTGRPSRPPPPPRQLRLPSHPTHPQGPASPLPSPPQGWPPPGRSPLPEHHHADPIPAEATTLRTQGPVSSAARLPPVPRPPPPPGLSPRPPSAALAGLRPLPPPRRAPVPPHRLGYAAPGRASRRSASGRAQACAPPRRYRRRRSSPRGSPGLASLGPPAPSFVAPRGRRQRMGATEAPEPSSGRLLTLPASRASPRAEAGARARGTARSSHRAPARGSRRARPPPAPPRPAPPPEARPAAPSRPSAPGSPLTRGPRHRSQRARSYCGQEPPLPVPPPGRGTGSKAGRGGLSGAKTNKQKNAARSKKGLRKSA
ncbi:basic proline-rich protein-like [Phalacrocorax carbo]|uniref:basic proline-rich protein-like n=1 Tax=Phalacrocorax carbo TaxID=9209 RepID=UPI003119F5F1